MNIKKIITGLALSMLLSSGTANADWGDVYYCQMTSFNSLTIEGEKESWKLEKFKFKLDQTKKTMEFGTGGYLNNISFELEVGAFFPSEELWYAKSFVGIVKFEEGKFLLAAISEDLKTISANCDKF